MSSLVGYRHRETIGTLRHLLKRAELGEIAGLQFTIDDLVAGEDVTGYTGSYRQDPGRIAAILGRLCVRLSNVADRVADLFGARG